MIEGNKNMSFVAMIHNQNGIVAIADSKSTINYAQGLVEEEKNRDTQKIFYNKNFILLTFGTNEVIFNNGNYKRLEDIINELLNDDDNHVLFIDKLSHYIHQNQNPDNQYSFNFIVGTSEFFDNENRFVSYSININNNGVTKSNYSIKTGLVAGGCHSQIINTLNVSINWSIDEMIQKLEKLITISMQLEETFSTYSAVGGNIKVVTMDSSKNINAILLKHL